MLDDVALLDSFWLRGDVSELFMAVIQRWWNPILQFSAKQADSALLIKKNNRNGGLTIFFLYMCAVFEDVSVFRT